VIEGRREARQLHAVRRRANAALLRSAPEPPGALGPEHADVLAAALELASHSGEEADTALVGDELLRRLSLGPRVHAGAAEARGGRGARPDGREEGHEAPRVEERPKLRAVESRHGPPPERRSALIVPRGVRACQ